MRIAAIAFLAVASATTLTYRMAPHERACFYTVSETLNEKMAFYFAIQTGGNFDIDFDVVSPKGTIVVSGNKERQRDIVFAAQEVGEYSFCFSNMMRFALATNLLVLLLKRLLILILPLSMKRISSANTTVIRITRLKKPVCPESQSISTKLNRAFLQLKKRYLEFQMVSMRLPETKSFTELARIAT